MAEIPKSRHCCKFGVSVFSRHAVSIYNRRWHLDCKRRSSPASNACV